MGECETITTLRLICTYTLLFFVFANVDRGYAFCYHKTNDGNFRKHSLNTYSKKTISLFGIVTRYVNRVKPFF